MNEKKNITISLGTVICIIIIILLLLALFGMWFYYNNIINKNNPNVINSTSINNENSSNNSNNENVVENKINNSNNENVVENKINNEKTFSDSEVKQALQNYLDLIGAKEAAPEELLNKLKLIKKDYKATYGLEDDNYVKTDIKYSEYKNTMLNYVSEKLFNEKFTTFYKEIDGILYYFDGGASGMTFKVIKISLNDNSSTLKYIGQVEDLALDGTKTTKTMEFGIKDYNGKCVITYCE